MKGKVRGGAGRRLRYVLALAAALGTAVAMPVLAAEPVPEEGTVGPQIVGGEPVDDGRYEFVASLQYEYDGGGAYQKHFCGGTLIDRNGVLTAAHCVEGLTASRLSVIVGRTKLDVPEGQRRSVTAIFRHPRYVDSSVGYRFDAAVLKLGGKVGNIDPVVVPKPDADGPEAPGRLLTVAGWGSTVKQDGGTGRPDNYPKRMQEAKVPVVSDARAEGVYGYRYAPRLMVAAGREGKDTCQGDSGGPLFEKEDGRVLQVGITSFGNGCGRKGYPGVYTETNAGAIRSFIYDRAAR